MNSKDLPNTPRDITSKAKEFRYLILLLVFLGFLDLTLYQFENAGVLSLSFSYVKENLSVGKTLVFMSLLSMYLAFFIPLLKYTLIWSTVFIPSWAHSLIDRREVNRSYKDYVYSWDLRQDAIKENNGIKYAFHKERENSLEKENEVEFYSLSLLTLIIAGIFISPNTPESVTYWFNLYLLDFSEVSQNKTVTTFFWMLVLVSFYLGICRGILSSRFDRERIYFPNYKKEDKPAEQ